MILKKPIFIGTLLLLKCVFSLNCSQT